MSTFAISTPSDREVELTRVFSAPRRTVFAALTQPDLLRKWYGPAGWTLQTCEIDLKPEGKWRFVLRKPDGKEIGQYGVYREIVADELLTNTESWEDWDPGETLVTTRLTDEADGTRFTATMLFPTKEVRDFILESGMEKASEMYDRMEEVITA